MTRRDLLRIKRRLVSLSEISADAVRTAADVIDAIDGHRETEDVLGEIARFQKELRAVEIDVKRTRKVLRGVKTGKAL